MIRTRISALLLSLAFFATVVAALGATAKAEEIRVVNTTPIGAWITLYADVGAFGWAQHKLSRPGMVEMGRPWVYSRNGKDDNGPWKIRLEVTSKGTRYDQFTTVWFDGSQRRNNVAGDPNTYLFVCEDAKGYFWSFKSNCSTHENTAGI
jgi:hypothetical protein